MLWSILNLKLEMSGIFLARPAYTLLQARVLCEVYFCSWHFFEWYWTKPFSRGSRKEKGNILTKVYDNFHSFYFTIAIFNIHTEVLMVPTVRINTIWQQKNLYYPAWWWFVFTTNICSTIDAGYYISVKQDILTSILAQCY